MDKAEDACVCVCVLKVEIGPSIDEVVRKLQLQMNANANANANALLSLSLCARCVNMQAVQLPSALQVHPISLRGNLCLQETY